MVAVDGTSLQRPRERDQLAALIDLRWRLFTQALRSTESKVVFAFFLSGRVLVAGFAVGAGVASAFAAYIGYRYHGPALVTVLSTIFLGWQSLGLLRGTTPRGVEAELLRFPFRFRTYVLLWLASGFFEGGTLLGTFACLGVLTGLLLAGAGAGLGVGVPLLFLLCNFVLSRALYLRLNRLLAKRRTRQLVLIASSLLGLLPRVLQTNRHALDPLTRLHLPHALHTALQVTPPFLALNALRDASPWLPLLGLAVWDAALMADLGFGLRRAFRGELLQEFAAAGEPARLRTQTRWTRNKAETAYPALIVAQMEWNRLRHSGTAFYEVFSPLLFLVIFGARLASVHKYGSWVLAGAAMYMGLQLPSINAFGKDGTGVQCFLLLPVPLREVLLGKNIFGVATYAVQIASVALLILLVAHRLDVAAVLFTMAWAACYSAVAFALCNRRSLRMPFAMPTERVTFSVTRRRRNTAGGSWVLLLMMFGTALLGAVIAGVSVWIKHPALAPAIMLPFTLAGALFYRRSLQDPALNGDITAAEPLMETIARV